MPQKVDGDSELCAMQIEYGQSLVFQRITFYCPNCEMRHSAVLCGPMIPELWMFKSFDIVSDFVGF